MNTRNRRPALLALALLGTAVVTATLALAQQAPGPAPPADQAPTSTTGPAPGSTTPATPPPTPTATPPPPAPATDAAAQSATGPAAQDEKSTTTDPEDAPPPKPAAAKGSPQRFEPTEKVRPDFDVAFPIDI